MGRWVDGWVDRWVGEWVQGAQTGNLIHDVLKCSPPNESPLYLAAVSVQKMCVCVCLGWLSGGG